ncbi:MAG: hypothetical protein QM710_00995 [Flavobacterium sp.]
MKKEDMNNLSGLSLEELNKRTKTVKTVTAMLAAVLFIQFAVGIYLLATKGFNVFVILPVAFLPILIANYINIKKLNEEIARRK